MFRTFCVFLVLSLMAVVPGWALDRAALSSTLADLAQGISQTAYTMSEREGTAERDAYEAAAAKTERAERELKTIVSGIESAEDLSAALEEVKKFGTDSKLNGHTGAVALQMLRDRASFLKLEEAKAGADVENAVKEIALTDLEKAEAPQLLLSQAQRNLILVQVPVAQAVISVEDNKENRRVENLKQLFDRHQVRVLSTGAAEAEKGTQTNFYIEGKKFVLEALMRNFKGSEVSSNLRAYLVVTTGGFWGKTSIDVTVSPKPNAAETGSLAWYQAVLEKDPFKWLAENDSGKLSQLGKVENVAGENKLHLKNAKLDIWVLPANGTQKDAIYENHVEFGDIYVSAR